MRDDGKGFATSPLIPEPSDPNHPVPFKMLTETEASVNNARDDVIKTAQQVAANTQAVVQNTQITATNTQTAQQAATSALSSRQSADESENMARKWASNPENEVVLDEKYSAYHYAQKAAQSAANLASAESSATQSATIATQKAEEATQAAKKAESLAVGEVDYAKVLNVPRSNINTEGIVQLSSATNSDSETEAATSKAVKTAYDKAVEAKTTADGKVGLSGNEEIAGDKLFRSQTKFQNGVLISANKGHWDNGYKVYIGADSDNAHLVFGDDTLRLHGSNHRISYNNYHLFHEGYKPRFNEHIINKPNTLAGYGIGNFKVEQGQGDANGYKTDGNYYLASGQNLPENGEWHIEVVSGGATNAVRQIARKANDNKIKTRFFNGSNWSEWKDAGGDGVPIGAVVSFPRAVTNPLGFLRADGSTFSQQTFPDLYRTLGDSNQLPDLTRSDVGMTAYFAVDNIPSGWIAFDSIRSTVTQQNYPELYQYLVDKYSSISNVPLAEDRFIRNTGNGLNIGQTQSDEIKKHVHRVRTHWADSSDSSIFYDKTKTVIDSRLRTATTTDDNLSDNGFMHPLLDSPMATGGAETRPRAIALKLCIKAKNTFDDVQFWVKAFGVVENVGALDAGTLAQNMQALSARVDQEIEENKQYTLREINNAKSDINEQFLQAKESLSQISTLKTVWQGNVSSGSINISEKCFGKTLILYLQSSSGHRLDDNNNIEIVSFEVGAEIEGKRGGVSYWQTIRKVTVYNPRNYAVTHVEVDTLDVTVDGNGTTINIVDLSNYFVKRIDIR
ncbi:tail fiber protein [Haemophilus influenzae]|nr:tail fiber protein [Haemophilus influenzae]